MLGENLKMFESQDMPYYYFIFCIWYTKDSLKLLLIFCSGEWCGLWASCFNTAIAERNCTYFSSLQLLKVFLEFAKRQLDENVTDENVDNEQNSLEQSLRRRTSSREQGRNSSQGSGNVVWLTEEQPWVSSKKCVMCIHGVSSSCASSYTIGININIERRKGIRSECYQYFTFFFG